MTEQVLTEKAGGVLTITLNRPEKKNAISAEMYQAIIAAVDASNDDRDVRVVLMQGVGDMFSAGHDVGKFAADSAAKSTERSWGEKMLLTLAGAKKPLVAAVHGRAIGIGFTLLLHFDLIYVAEDALLSCPFMNLALTPEGASTRLMPARIGHVRTFEMFALGQAITGAKAAELGLANEAVPAGEVQAKARAAAEALAKRAPAAVAITKSLMKDVDALQAHIRHEFDLFYDQRNSPEAGEAFAAFMEKRPPNFG